MIPRSLKLEITETAIMENGENAVAMLKEIKELGVQLSIDDFGTGYSSLGYLQQFPIDTVKIDRVFVKSMEDGRQNGEIVRAVLALADSLNLEVVAEVSARPSTSFITLDSVLYYWQGICSLRRLRRRVEALLRSKPLARALIERRFRDLKSGIRRVRL